MEIRTSLIVNIGSASKKYALFTDNKLIGQFYFDKKPDEIVLTTEILGTKSEIQISSSHYQTAIQVVIELLEKQLINKNKIDCAGIRIVSPGTYFSQHRHIDNQFIKKLEHAAEYASLHINPILDEIKQLRTILEEIPFVSISDSAFHLEMPEYTRRYSLPKEIVNQFDIYRFGYHGISIQSVLAKSKKMLRVNPPKIIVCHLGSGSSITAIMDEKSFDTSMGFTPLEGLIMGTRIGTIDAAAILYLIEQGFNANELQELLNSRCGLLGLSGETADVRVLLENERKGSHDAVLSLKAFIHGIKKYIGAYAAAMGGLDLLIFTGAIGERSPIIRARICEHLEYAGISFNETTNTQTVKNDAFIHKDNAPVKIAVLLTEEQNEMHSILIRFFSK